MRAGRALAVIVAAVVVLAGPAGAGEGGEPDLGTIGLTFDDGPHPVGTPMVLDALDDAGVKATFFVLGIQAERYPDLVHEIVRRGHSVQVHGWSHRRFTRMDDATLADEISRTADLIERITRVRPTCVRPPYGLADGRVREVVEGLGFDLVIWDVNSADYATHSARTTAAQVIRRASAGADVLGHDTFGPVWREALPRIVAHVQEEGLGFATICENVFAHPTALQTIASGLETSEAAGAVWQRRPRPGTAPVGATSVDR